MPEERTTGGWRHIRKEDCPHLSEIKPVSPPTKTSCEDCNVPKDLRMCMTCGYVGCCESHHSHDTLHFRKLGHPLIKPYRCDYDWLWCYACNAFLK